MAIKGIGSTLSKGGSAISNLLSLDFPSVEVDKLEVTNLASTAKEFIPGIKDEGEVVAEILYDHDSYFDIIGWVGTSYSWNIATPDGTDGTFDGFITKVELSAKPNEPMVTKITIKVSGAVTVDEGS